MISRMEWEWKRGCSMARSLLETLGVVRNLDKVVLNGRMVASMRADLRKVFMKEKVHTTTQTSRKLMLDNSDEDRWMAMELKHSKMDDSLQGHSRMDISMEKD